MKSKQDVLESINGELFKAFDAAQEAWMVGGTKMATASATFQGGKGWDWANEYALDF